MGQSAWAERIGRVGVWAAECRYGDTAAIDVAAAELEELGYGALWIPGGIDDGVLGDLSRLLAKTRRMTIASGILNIWRHDPVDVAAWWKALPLAHQDRTLLGVGVSHAPFIGEGWGKPVEFTRDWLNRLAAAGMAMDRVCLAALGPKMVELAGALTAGAHPYLVSADHSASARAILGPDKLLAPEQGVVLESDPARARELILDSLVHYRRLPNYLNSWRRLGYSEEDIANASDHLLGGLFAIGSANDIAARIKVHTDGGADHVCIQVVTGAGLDGARKVWRALADELL